MSTDPTRSATLRREYRRKLRGQLRKLSAMIRRGIERNDALGLRSNQLNVNAHEMPIFHFESTDQKVDAFRRWLEHAERDGILNIVDRDNNPYIRQAYHKGVRHADYKMHEMGIDTPDPEDAFRLPRHQESLQNLYTRNYEFVEDAVNDMNDEVFEELTRGLSQGLNPTEIGRNIRGRIDNVGKYRGDLIGRTEIINAHSEAALNRYEEMGIKQIGYKVEVITAGDDNVCDICQNLANQEPYQVDEIRGQSFEFNDSLHRRQPPVHPNCRCALVPYNTNN